MNHDKRLERVLAWVDEQDFLVGDGEVRGIIQTYLGDDEVYRFVPMVRSCADDADHTYMGVTSGLGEGWLIPLNREES